MDTLGLVTGIDRDNGRVGAILDTGLARWLPDGFDYAGEAPAPLSVCWFVETVPGRYLCAGQLGDTRLVHHDDYTHVASPSVTTYLGDEPWVLRGSGGTRTQDATTLGDALGVLRYATNATINAFISESKDTDAYAMLTAPQAVWWSGRLAVNSVTAVAYGAGLASTPLWAVTGAAADRVVAGFDSTVSANWLLQTSASAVAATNLDTGIAADLDTWHHFDLVFVPGTWAALWIDGSGPYVSETGIPATTDALQPGLEVFTYAAAAKRLYVDWTRSEVVASVADPRLLDTHAARFGTDARVH